MTMSHFLVFVALGAAFFADGSRISAVNQQLLQEARLVADEVTRDQSIQTPMGTSPDLEELKKWAAFYASEEGGGLYNAKALAKAEKTLSSKHPDLEELKKWAAFYASEEGGGNYYAKALAKAEEKLAPRATPDHNRSDPAGDSTPGATPAKKATVPCSQPELPVHGSVFGPCSERMDQVADGATCTTQCKMHFTPEPRSLTCVEGNIGKYVCKKVIDLFELSCWAKCHEQGKGYLYKKSGMDIQCDCHGQSSADGPPEHLRPEQSEQTLPMTESGAQEQSFPKTESGAHTDKCLGVSQLLWISLMLAFGMYDLSH